MHGRGRPADELLAAVPLEEHRLRDARSRRAATSTMLDPPLPVNVLEGESRASRRSRSSATCPSPGTSTRPGRRRPRRIPPKPRRAGASGRPPPEVTSDAECGRASRERWWRSRCRARGEGASRRRTGRGQCAARRQWRTAPPPAAPRRTCGSSSPFSRPPRRRRWCFWGKKKLGVDRAARAARRSSARATPVRSTWS